MIQEKVAGKLLRYRAGASEPAACNKFFGRAHHGSYTDASMLEKGAIFGGKDGIYHPRGYLIAPQDGAVFSEKACYNSPVAVKNYAGFTDGSI